MEKKITFADFSPTMKLLWVIIIISTLYNVTMMGLTLAVLAMP